MRVIVAIVLLGSAVAAGGAAPATQGVADLAREVRDKGWIIYTAQTTAGNWALHLMRPDGSERRSITRGQDVSEVAGRFSPDGKKTLFYRWPKGEALDNNHYGLGELVIADANGANPLVWGKEYSWASWSSDGKQIACLTKAGVQLIDLATKRAARTLERKGIVEQLFWSPDGKWLCGTANGLGEQWAIGRLSVATGEINRVSDGDCWNCTSDWMPDSRQVLYSKGLPKTDGFAQLWLADGDGKERRLLYGETGRHIYGGAASPDGKYILFTRSREDLGQVDHSATTMGLMRLADAPTVGGESETLRKKYPAAKSGPVLDLGPGWEPHWTFAEIQGH